MAKVLVTGGAGFIGSHVVDLFLAKGYEVVVLDDLSTGRLSNLNPDAKFYQMDIRSPEVRSVFAAERPDYVSHHAAQIDVRRSVAEPILDAEVNILGSINLIECAKEFGVKHFIYISSGGAAYGEPERLPCDEEHPINPICQYGASKHTVEHYLYMYHANYGMPYTVLRYPNVFGPRQNPHSEAGVVAIFTGKMLRGEPVIVNGDGEQTRDFINVRDVAMANYRAAMARGVSGAFNIASGTRITINRLAAMLADGAGRRDRRRAGHSDGSKRMTEQELDEVYTRVCRKIEAAGAGRTELYLARLVLLLMGEVNDRARIECAIDGALEDGHAASSGSDHAR